MTNQRKKIAGSEALKADARQLSDAVKPTLARLGQLEPQHAFAFDLYLASVLGYFSLRAAYALDVAAGRTIDPGAQQEIGDWRRLVLHQSAIFGLLPDSDESPDEITVRAENRRLYALFGLTEDWIPRHLVESAPQPTELVS